MVKDASYRKYYISLLPGEEYYIFAEFINHIETHGSSVGKLLTVD